MTSVRWPVVGRGLLLVALVLGALYSLTHAIWMTGFWGVGWDALAYHQAWDGPLYGKGPGELGAYNYSPVFAQVIWPLTLLPWPVFCALSIAAAAVGVAWLCRPLPLLHAGLTCVLCSAQVLSGNIDWLMAVLMVLGITRGTPWLLAAVTKVVSCLGPVWFLARGDWRRLGTFTLALVGLAGLSYALSPQLWHDWVTFLVQYAGREAGMFGGWLPRWPVRFVGAIVLTVVAARLAKPSLLPVAMLLAAPVPGTGTWALLAAIPRLRAYERAEAASVDERLDPVGEDLLGERGGAGDPDAGQQVVLGDLAAGGALGADGQTAPGDDRVTQRGQR